MTSICNSIDIQGGRGKWTVRNLNPITMHYNAFPWHFPGILETLQLGEYKLTLYSIVVHSMGIARTQVFRSNC
jgi:hypothetical protein